MAKKPRFARTTISIPADLKRRMGLLKEDVNWSALACSAFQDKLVEISSRKKEKNKDDVIERLRASKKRNDNERTVAGREAGEAWVKESAEVAEIERLQNCWDTTGEYDRRSLFEDGDNEAFSAAERLVFIIRPEFPNDRSYASEFWDFLLGENGVDQADEAFMEGFIEGALDFWSEIKNKI